MQTLAVFGSRGCVSGCVLGPAVLLVRLGRSLSSGIKLLQWSAFKCSNSSCLRCIVQLAVGQHLFVVSLEHGKETSQQRQVKVGL